MSGLRPIIDNAVAAAIAEHPKYFTERGIEKAQTAITRKIMAALLRSDDGDKPDDTAPPPPPVDPVPLAVDPKSREGRAYTNLRQMAGASPPFRLGDGTISIPASAQRERVYVLADLPPESAWHFIFISERQQFGAWMEFFGDTLPSSVRRPIQFERNGQTGILMPWPWPPTVTGKVYTPDEAASA